MHFNRILRKTMPVMLAAAGLLLGGCAGQKKSQDPAQTGRSPVQSSKAAEELTESATAEASLAEIP